MTGGLWRGLWWCSVAVATALRGGPSSQLPFIPRRGEERGCWNCSFSLFFFLCCDLDEQSLKCSPAIFLPVLEDTRMFKGCPEEVPLAQPFAPTPARGRRRRRGRGAGRPCRGRCSPRDRLSLSADAVVSALKKAQPSAWGQILFSAWRSDLIFHVPYLKKKHTSLAGLKEREKTNKRLRCIFAPAGPTCAAVFGVRLPGQNVDLILNPYDSANSVYGRFSF